MVREARPPPSFGAGSSCHPQALPPPGALPHAPSSSSAHENSPRQRTNLLTASFSSCLSHNANLVGFLPTACALYSVKTGRSPPKAYGAFWPFARERERGCRIGAVAYAESGDIGGTATGRGCGREWEGLVSGDGGKEHTIRSGRAHMPENQATYFDGDWENTVNKPGEPLSTAVELANPLATVNQFTVE
ncbi:hypothetical protein C8R45DRAFT_945865 [Mycena sanguinolenta]|nr:hypothetical protein C8R45DRAFT_945865 [Mycena sanguinolenta]